MRNKRVLMLPLILFSLSRCVADTNAESPLPESQFTQLNSGDYTESGTYLQKQSKVISTQEKYTEELLNYTRTTPASVDFNQGKVLLVDMGQRTSGGYSIEVSSIDVADNYVTANVSLKKPGQNCLTTQALTNPYQFVFIPTLKEILVKETLITYQCDA